MQIQLHSDELLAVEAGDFYGFTYPENSGYGISIHYTEDTEQLFCHTDAMPQVAAIFLLTVDLNRSIPIIQFFCHLFWWIIVLFLEITDYDGMVASGWIF